MAAINDLIAQIEDEALRERIEKEVEKISKQKKFGLVFEEHLPECTPLYDIPVRKGVKVSLRDGKANETFTVLKIEDGKAHCLAKNSDTVEEYSIDELVTTAEFGDPIYPYLKPLDSVCNAPDSDLWHTLIEADNYHALQLLEYLYAGKVDCIYIDPPYNSGATDWKYNNRYVDEKDSYRHSMWLSFMKKRLELAKKLLNPEDSVLIVTIDENEYLHLGCLLEEMFPEARIQMISNCINPAGAQRDMQFARTDEYIFFIEFGKSKPEPLALSPEWLVKADESFNTLYWRSLSRAGSNDSRERSEGCFYPIYVAQDGSRIVEVGVPVGKGNSRDSIKIIEGTVPVFPIHIDGSEGCWMQSPENLKKLINKGYVKLGGFTERGMAIKYLNKKEIDKVETGGIKVVGRNIDGSIEIDDSDFQRKVIAGTQWNISSHNARSGGSEILKSIFKDKIFSFPKSLYAVQDTINFFVSNKPNALIIDFFAGSGTTLHAVNLLNAIDGGCRRCIMVTNNEVSAKESDTLKNQGFNECSEEWNNLGIARHITWPRTKCSILGIDIKGHQLKGTYGSIIETYEKIEGEKGKYRKVKTQAYPGLDNINASDGFKANAAFFKLGFLDKTAVSLGMQFKEMLPTLWMKAGAYGVCPETDDSNPDMLILPENRMAILNDENRFNEFAEKLADCPEAETVYLVTDYETGFVAMSQRLPERKTYQLYRDYLDNFRINAGRNNR